MKTVVLMAVLATTAVAAEQTWKQKLSASGNEQDNLLIDLGELIEMLPKNELTKKLQKVQQGLKTNRRNQMTFRWMIRLEEAHGKKIPTDRFDRIEKQEKEAARNESACPL